MGKSHEIDQASSPHQRLRRPSSPASPKHPLLSLQQQVGNRAVTTALRAPGRGPHALLMLQRQAGNRAAVAAVQRNGGGESAVAAPSEALAEEALGANVEEEIARQVGQLPPLEDVPVTENNVQDGVNEANAVRSGVDELGVGQSGALADWSRREFADGAEVDRSVVEELQGAQAEVAPSPAAKPSRAALALAAVSRTGNRIAGAGRRLGGQAVAGARWAGSKAVAGARWAGSKAVAGARWAGSKAVAGARWAGSKAVAGARWAGSKAVAGARWAGSKAAAGASWLGAKIAGGAGAAWGAIKSEKEKLSTPEGRRDRGGQAQAVGGIASPMAGHAQELIDNPVTEGTAHLYGQSAVEQVHKAGESMSATSTTLEHPEEFAHSFTSGAAEALHAVASVVGIFFSALKAAVDFRSLVSSIRVYRALKRARASARVWGSSPALVEAVEYALKQKYEKIFKRAFGVAMALAALGVGLAVLIANPVGASLAAVIIGGIGASMFLYKMGRKAWKKWGTNTLGQKRLDMAKHLYNQMRSRDVLALEAVRSLHLDPEAVAAAGATKGPNLIFRKLKSA